MAIFVWISSEYTSAERLQLIKVCKNREQYHLISFYVSSAFKTTTVF